MTPVTPNLPSRQPNTSDQSDGGFALESCRNTWAAVTAEGRQKRSFCAAAISLSSGYSITSSARARNASGIVMPSALAVVQLERSGCLEHDLEKRAKGRYGCQRPGVALKAMRA